MSTIGETSQQKHQIPNSHSIKEHYKIMQSTHICTFLVDPTIKKQSEKGIYNFIIFLDTQNQN